MNPARSFEKARRVNSTTAAFPAWISSEFAPPWGDPGTATGRVVKRLAHENGGGLVPCWLQFSPYGAGAADSTFTVRISGFRRISEPTPSGQIQFVRELIVALTCTVGAGVGLAGGHVLDTERFCDTIAISFEGTMTGEATRDGTAVLYSPANDTPANVLVPLVGFEGIEIEWAGASGMNALLSFLDS